MNLTGNTILITGGGSGIGRGLAEEFHKLGNQVVIAGRRKKVLDETTAANPGMKSLQLDIEDPTAIRDFAARVVKDFPALNVLINNAGIMRPEKLLAAEPKLDVAEATVAINLLGPIRSDNGAAAAAEKATALDDCDCLVGIGFSSFGADAELLRIEVRDSLLDAVAAVSTEDYDDRGD